MRKFSQREKSEGELAVREMSLKAQEVYDGSDCISVIKYIDYDASYKAEAEAEKNGVDYYPGELDVIRYAVNIFGEIDLGMTFEEAQSYLEDWGDSLNEYE